MSTVRTLPIVNNSVKTLKQQIKIELSKWPPVSQEFSLEKIFQNISNKHW